MNHITNFAESFMKLFQLGGETFISWMTNIVPLVLMLLIAMNTLIAFLGEEKVNSLAKISAKNPLCWGIRWQSVWDVSYQNIINLVL